MRFLCCLIFMLSTTLPALAERLPSHCLAFAERDTGPPVQYASLGLNENEVGLRYIGHSMYEISSHGGLRIVTDYNGGVGFTPDVVTMNHAHASHWTPSPDPNITHILQGWGQNGEPADYEIDLGEVLVRNVTSDIRSPFSGFEPDGNSIFIFEMAGLCIGHLGHLHQELSDEQYARIGRLDVVMANVDGGVSLNTETMTRVLKRLRASVVLPMHWWGRFTLNEFLEGMSDGFVIEERTDDTLVMSLDLLPRVPTIYVLQPQLPPEDYE
ncbi:MAG: MBL fold metallo-hydrolase [Pseudomonadota bacterium]